MEEEGSPTAALFKETREKGEIATEHNMKNYALRLTVAMDIGYNILANRAARLPVAVFLLCCIACRREEGFIMHTPRGS